MTITYINPLGHLKEADLSVEQIAKLKVKGYEFVDKYDFELPEVPRITIHRREFVECESCSA